MKTLMTIILVLLGIIGKAEENFSTIYLWHGKGYLKTAIFELGLNSRRITSFRTRDLIEYKIYSTGIINIEVIFTGNGLLHYSKQLKVEQGKKYYLYAWAKGFKGIEEELTETNQYFGDPDYFNRKLFFEEDFNNPIGKISKDAISKEPGQGTCFALNADGYLITNYHVIENAKEITVKGIDGDYSTKYGATLIANDKTNDLALLKIGNKNVRFNGIPYSVRSSGVQQGEKVYAIGFPIAQVLGQEVKLTDGIISAKSGVDGDVSKFQISAAVNPGNSSGPLIDEQGNLIGVIYAKSTIAESAGYAVKASYLQTFLSNVDGLEYSPLSGSLNGKAITEIIAEWKKFIFIVETN